MTEKTRNRLIVAGLVLALILAVVIFSLFGKKDVEEITPDVEVAELVDILGVSDDIAVDTPVPLDIPVSEEEIDTGKIAATQMAELFSERYGSYSNQGNFQNLHDLLPIMTDGYKEETKKYLDSVEGRGLAEIYEGYTSTKVTTEELSFNEDSRTASFQITLQQIMVVGSSDPIITYPKLRVDMLKVGDDWRISDAEWM